LRPHTYLTLIGLLASCGLRPSEAIRLRVADVDLAATPPHLRILKTKFRKSRLVPLHATTASALSAYVHQRRQLGYAEQCDHFFVSESRHALNYHVVWRTFVALARKAGIRGGAGERGVSLHDLRHTFAVRRLITWYREGVDVHARLPELSVYLGHVRPEGTYWYLSAAPELLSVAAERFEAYTSKGATP
jgi:integrase